MLAPQMVVINFPTLKHLLIRPLGGKNNIVKKLVLFDDAFHITGCKTSIRVVMREIGYVYDLQV